MGQLTTSTNPAATQAAKYDGFGKLARQDVTLGTLTHTTTSVRDASGQTLRTQYLPVQLDFGKCGDSALFAMFAQPSLPAPLPHGANVLCSPKSHAVSA
ncbi:hypothetical protein [Mesorhizobium sp. M0184]|uniref:hypothetical protein n=1 Tax=Mesorhizobium sp. M0184 TaxID=2956906 RepID=UPI0033386EE7